MEWTSFVIIALTFVLAGFVKGVVGLGLPTIGMGLLATVMAPAQAASLLVVPSFITNLQQARTWPMLLGICVGTLAVGRYGGGALLTASDGARASIGLGIVLALYGALGLMSVRFVVPARAEFWLAPIIGITTGAVTAMTGVYMIPSAPYLQAIGLEKDDLVLAMGLAFTAATVALAIVLLEQGALRTSDAGASLLALVPALIGMGLGQWVRTRARADIFRICFFAAALLLGAHLVLRAWM
jgi:uncharacterized membrane protein YfcA